MEALRQGQAFGSDVFADIHKGSGSGSPSDFAVLGNHLYFKADDGIHGTELWKTDGTVYGTMMVKDPNPGNTGSNPTGLTAFNNALYFAATDASGTELWKSDGTANGTVLFKDLVPGSGSGNPTNIRVDGNQLRFKAAQESWNSDGTLAGTVVQGPPFSDYGYANSATGIITQTTTTTDPNYGGAMAAKTELSYSKIFTPDLLFIAIPGPHHCELKFPREFLCFQQHSLFLGHRCQRHRIVEERRNAGRYRDGEGSVSWKLL